MKTKNFIIYLKSIASNIFSCKSMYFINYHLKNYFNKLQSTCIKQQLFKLIAFYIISSLLFFECGKQFNCKNLSDLEKSILMTKMERSELEDKIFIYKKYIEELSSLDLNQLKETNLEDFKFSNTNEKEFLDKEDLKKLTNFIRSIDTEKFSQEVLLKTLDNIIHFISDESYYKYEREEDLKKKTISLKLKKIKTKLEDLKKEDYITYDDELLPLLDDKDIDNTACKICDIKKYSLIPLRNLESNILILGCGKGAKGRAYYANSKEDFEKYYSEHLHEKEDTIDIDLTMNPTVCANLFKESTYDYFTDQNKRYSKIIDESGELINDIFIKNIGKLLKKDGSFETNSIIMMLASLSFSKRKNKNIDIHQYCNRFIIDLVTKSDAFLKKDYLKCFSEDCQKIIRKILNEYNKYKDTIHIFNKRVYFLEKKLSKDSNKIFGFDIKSRMN